MANTDDSIKPNHSKGTEDPHRWLDQLDVYILTTRKDAEQSRGIFGLLLDGHARDWYDSLPAARKESYTTLKDAFHERDIEKTNNWKEATSLFQNVQKPGENILDFIASMRRKAIRAKIPETTAMSAILSGIHSTSRLFILQYQPKNIEEIIKHARSLQESSNSVLGITTDTSPSTPIHRVFRYSQT